MFDLFSNPNLLLAIFGGVFILLGITGLTGWYKAWYWRSQRVIYGYIPLGLLFILSIFEKTLSQDSGSAIWFLRAGYAVLLLIGMLGFVRPPEAIKPAWVKLIEAQPKAVYEEMAAQARADSSWRNRAKTREDLEAWIKAAKQEVSHGHKKTSKPRGR